MFLFFGRGILGDTTLTLQNERQFIIPVSLELTLKRNLSSAWYNALPDLEILAHLAAIHVTLTHEDLCSTIAILNENLIEGAQISTSSGSSKVVKTTVKSKENLQDNQFLNREMSEKENEDENSEFYTSIKFTFFMESFIFDALNNQQVSYKIPTILLFVVQTYNLAFMRL